MLDLKGMRCPQPLIELKLAMRARLGGGQLVVVIDDPVSKRDIPNYLREKGVDFSILADKNGDLTLEVLVSE